jgi:hypothetical protein
MDASRVDADADEVGADAPARNVRWTFVAPLGELPDGEALREAGEAIGKGEQKRYRPILAKEGARGYTEFLRGLLEKVRGIEGIFSFQVAEVEEEAARTATRRLVLVPVLAAVGVHASRSVYLVYYGLIPVDSRGRPYDITEDLRKGLPQNPEARKELEVLQRRLLDLHPTLEAALKRAKKPLFFAGVLRRGHLLFPIDLGGEISYVLLETLLLPLKASWPVKDLEEAGSEFLARALCREPTLKALPPETVRKLLEGRGDAEGAAREIAMDLLGGF